MKKVLIGIAIFLVLLLGALITLPYFFKDEIISQVKAQTNMQHIELTSEVYEKIIGGFVLQLGDKLVDASIAYDLNNIRKQFLNNDFIYKIR